VNGVAGALAINTSVQKLNISANSLPDVGVIEISDALAVNSSLKVLKMNGNRSVTASGWVAFFNRLRYSACSLEKLDVSSNDIDDEGAAALVDLVAGMITLKRLKLTNCNSITNNGWRVIARIPQTSSNVTSIKLGGNNFNNDAVVFFAAALATNKCLSSLILDGREITDRIWGAFSNILCDNSSVQSTYLSNHTLHTLETTGYYAGDNWTQVQVPDNIARVVELNETNQDKVVLARQKIISNHFSASRINTQAFAVMSVPVLPHAIEWIGRDLLGFSLLYQVSRSVLVPKLFE
jgi:Ran GTPase-activating protein (RanGAP) involved in mRNA processing and transport